MVDFGWLESLSSVFNRVDIEIPNPLEVLVYLASHDVGNRTVRHSMRCDISDVNGDMNLWSSRSSATYSNMARLWSI